MNFRVEVFTDADADALAERLSESDVQAWLGSAVAHD